MFPSEVELMTHFASFKFNPLRPKVAAEIRFSDKDGDGNLSGLKFLFYLHDKDQGGALSAGDLQSVS